MRSYIGNNPGSDNRLLIDVIIVTRALEFALGRNRLIISSAHTYYAGDMSEGGKQRKRKEAM